MMDDVIIIQDDDSENSVVEVEIPRKPTPPLINVEDEDIILNIVEENKELVLAKTFIESDEGFLAMKLAPGNSHSVNSPKHWTSDMIKFYNDDWGDEDQFTVQKLQEKMDKTPSLWKVSKKDRLQKQNSIRKSNIKCWNCGQRGHHLSLCPEEQNVPKCHMCGNQGHLDYSCPNSKCLNCGSYSKEYVISCFKCKNEEYQTCPRCNLKGHNFFNCPDHWRLFHLTTGTTSVQIPEKNSHRSDKKMWCCNCGRKGHCQINCWNKKDLCAFKDTLPFVVSYQTAFNYNQLDNKQNEMPLKKNKGKKNRDELEKSLRINPMHKAMIKNSVQLKKQLKKFKKKKRNRNKRKGKQGLVESFFQAVA